MALGALVIGVQQAEISAEAADADRPEAAAPSAAKAVPGVHRVKRIRRTSRRDSALESRVNGARSDAAPPPATQNLATPGATPPEQPPIDTQSELRNWIKDNATLLSNASLLISISALALNLLPETGFLDPYIKALIFGAALLLLIEMHHQWPDDLQLHMFRPMSLPENHSWRMVAFAFIMQVATLVFAVWATLTTPLILVPLTALAVVVGFRQWYFRRFRGVFARGFGIIALIAVLLLSELMMVIVWAAITGEQITIQLWADERPGFTIETAPAPDP